MVHTTTGRLWEDHLWHLGYRSKGYRVQVTLFTQHSNSNYKLWTPKTPNTSTIVFFCEKLLLSKTPEARFGDQTEHVRPPKPISSITNKKMGIWTKSGFYQTSLFLSLNFWLQYKSWLKKPQIRAQGSNWAGYGPRGRWGPDMGPDTGLGKVN